ncbi:MAG: succinate dehydrogenase [Hyphomicrobiales bacterium]|nr:succinate dehydrogenase [Hyphomicrobiales bacterium]
MTARPTRLRHGHATYWAYLVHRLTGLALVLFLPFHFLFLASGLEDAARLDGLLRWTENPLVKLAEGGLVVLLAAHLTGGLRLLAVEFLPWRDGQKTLVSLAAGASLAVGLVFLINAF